MKIVGRNTEYQSNLEPRYLNLAEDPLLGNEVDRQAWERVDQVGRDKLTGAMEQAAARSAVRWWRIGHDARADRRLHHINTSIRDSLQRNQEFERDWISLIQVDNALKRQGVDIYEHITLGEEFAEPLAAHHVMSAAWSLDSVAKLPKPTEEFAKLTSGMTNSELINTIWRDEFMTSGPWGNELDRRLYTNSAGNHLTEAHELAKTFDFSLSDACLASMQRATEDRALM